MPENYWELIIAEKETIEATGRIKTHMIVSTFSLFTRIFSKALKRLSI